MSHFSGRPESGSLNRSRDGQEARQKSHSSYSLPSMMYLSLPGAFRRRVLTRVDRKVDVLSGSRTTRMRDLAGLLLLYLRRGVKRGADRLRRPGSRCICRHRS